MHAMPCTRRPPGNLYPRAITPVLHYNASFMAAAEPSSPAAPQDFDPDSYRMSIGEHLEELRRRLIFGLIGFVLALTVCFIFGETAITWFSRPLSNALHKAMLPPQLYSTELTDGFLVYMEISFICAAALSSPWMLYQLWLFVAAGLYPKERKVITKYIPLSISLLLVGMAFVYLFVLPITIQFFIHFSTHIPLKYAASDSAIVTTQPSDISHITRLPGHPDPLENGMIWFDTSQNQIKVYLSDQVRTLAFGPANLITPIITLPQYINMVVGMLLSFALAFQTPLVVLALTSLGILDIVTLKKIRKYIFFIAAIVAAIIVPDVVTGMIALLIPLYLLFELGIYLASRSAKKKLAAEESGE